MEFYAIKLMSIDMLGLSQIYLSLEKLESVMEWFNPQCMDNFQPLPVHDFGNNTYTLTDGHTRTYAAYKNGVSVLPVVYDNYDIVTNQVGQKLYNEDIAWCKRFNLFHIKHLEGRILNKTEYQKLWIERCDRSYNLLTVTSHNEYVKLQKLVSDLFLYGASEDMSVLYFENKIGELFLYKNNTLMREQ